MAEAIEKFREHYEEILNQKTQVDRKFTLRIFLLIKKTIDKNEGSFQINDDAQHNNIM